ncbi:MAG: ester cyclase, partial [Chloroflexota bacterium]
FDYPVMAPNKAALRGQIQMMITSFSDLNAEIIDLLADGDKVAHYSQFHARQTGSFFGIPPTGKEISWTEVHMSRVKDGKIVEHWGHIDVDRIMRELGVSPPKP